MPRITNRIRSLSYWRLLAALLCAPVALPVGAVLLSVLQPQPGLWPHLLDYVLPTVALNSLVLLLGVGAGVAVLGTLLAALVALCEFPGRRFFSWALLLPLALPGYVLATVAIGQLDYAGPLATWLRGCGWQLPDIRNAGGVIAVLILVLYPYVYLVARNAFATQGVRALEAARMLGHGPLRSFWRVALPLALPWISAGTLLALMETLADFGTVSAFNYDSFTTAIYKAWFGLYSIPAALQLCAVLLLFVIVLLIAERAARGRQRYDGGVLRAARQPLGRWRWVATLVCALVLLLAFALPVAQLVAWAHAHWRADLDTALLQRAVRTLLLGGIAAALTTVVALLIAYATRQAPGHWTRNCARLATLGYAFPGPLLALGLFVPLAVIVRLLNERLGLNLLVQGGLLLMLLAYGVRFLAVAHGPLAAGLLRVRLSLDEAARLLGVGGLRQLTRVHLPLLRGSALSAALLVLVDVMKEMPITLMTRPFGWDTLAVRVFELTSEGEWTRAALPALGIVAVGLLPVWWLDRGFEARPAPHSTL